MEEGGREKRTELVDLCNNLSLSCGTETGSCHFFAVLTKRLSVSPSLSSISQDDDFVFEDFARLRLKGVVDDKDEDC